MLIERGPAPKPGTVLWMDDPANITTQDIIGLLDVGLDAVYATLAAELARRGIVTPAGRPTPN